MKLTTPISFNITLHKVSDFSYCDQGILTLTEKNGQWQVRLNLAEYGNSDTLLNLTHFDSVRALGFSSQYKNQAPKEALTLLVSELGPTLCISGQGLWPDNKEMNRGCFLVGYALSLYQ